MDEQEDNNFRIYLTRPKRILHFFGAWPKECTTWRQIIMHWTYLGLILFTQHSFLLFEFIYIAEVIGDMEELTASSFLLFTQASLCYKFTVFLMTRKTLISLLRLMKQEIFLPRDNLHKKRLEVHALKISRLCSFFLLCAGTSCSMWTLIPLLNFFNNGTRIFPFKIWMPFSPDYLPQYALGYIYQLLSIYISALLFSAVDNIPLALIMFGCAQIEIIGDKLKKNIPLTLKSKARERLLKSNTKILVDCIKHHQAVSRLIDIVENTYHAIIFFQLSGTVFIICIIGLRISVVELKSMQFASMVSYFMTISSQLFLYCWCGQEITIRSELLREWLYKCPWYEQDFKFQKSLSIAMECMTKPIIFKAGHYIPLSWSTFVSILRSSYSYFAVLRETN